MAQNTHCCAEMARHLSDGEIALVYVPEFREYGVEYREGFGGGIQQIRFCPWCGVRLPKNLRDEWFAVLDDELRMEPDDPLIPEEMRSDAWWRSRGL